MKFFAFFFVALAAVLALVGADSFQRGEPGQLLREARSASGGDAAPGKGGYGGYGGGYKGGNKGGYKG